MRKLPILENAIVEVRKLRDYCLSPDHPRGRHKAKVFASALELTANDAEELRGALLSAALSEETTPTEEDEYGRRCVLDFEMSTETGSVAARSWGGVPRSRSGSLRTLRKSSGEAVPRGFYIDLREV